MADARALFNRHYPSFQKWHKQFFSDGGVTERDAAIIYAACIIAESIRTEMDETEIKVRES